MRTNYTLFIILALIIVFSSKQIIIYNEEIIVAFCFVAFVVYTQRAFGKTVQATFDERQNNVLSELQQYLTLKQAFLTELIKQHELRSNSLRFSTQMIGDACIHNIITGCGPKCKKTVQAILSQQCFLKIKTLVAVQDQSRERFQAKIVTSFRNTVYDQFRFAKLRAHQPKLVSQSIALLNKNRNLNVLRSASQPA